MNSINEIKYPFKAPILKVIQPLGEFYVAVLPANLLLEVTFAHPLQVDVSVNGYELKGNQRKLQEERLKEIGRYIDTVEAAFPNSIILATDDTDDIEESEDEKATDRLDRRWSVTFSDESGVGQLTIPTSEKMAAIVDGQHRLYGFTKSSNPDRIEMMMLCAIYLDLPNPFQAYVFATINSKQKTVTKSQTYELYGYNLEDEPSAAWSPEKSAVFLCRKLNTDVESCFENHIIVASQDDERAEKVAENQRKNWGVSTATIVEGLLRLFSSNPKRDRDFMHKYEVGQGRQRSLLSDINDRTPLREYYIQNNDALIYTLVKNYFNAVNRILWIDDYRSYIRKTVGIQALFDVLRPLSVEGISQKNLSEAFFEDRLRSCIDIDFTDNFFGSSGVGRQHIRNVLELCLKLKKLEDISEVDREEYRRILKNKTNFY